MRIMGTFYWFIGKQKKALHWWRRSIASGERMGALVELFRSYFEVGKPLSGPDSNFKELDGIDAKEYLDKAKKMFQEMALQWDLDELDRISTYNPCA